MDTLQTWRDQGRAMGEKNSDTLEMLHYVDEN